MSTRHLNALFNPRSIAVIGASERATSLGGMVLRNIRAGDYPGQLLVVNRQGYDKVHGIRCERRVKQMPWAPDLAIICTPPETVPKLVRQLGECGVRTAMVMTGGMSRSYSRNGEPLMYAVRDAAKKAGVRILGPNTIGIMSPDTHLNATYAHMGVLPGKIGFVGQSGTVASAVIDWAFARGVGFSRLLTLGDGMDIAHDDLIDYLAEDPGTRAILLHIEHIPNPRRFISSVRAASRSKPVIAVKSGRFPDSEYLPHTLPDGITQTDPIYDAALQRAGVLRVNGLDEMFDALESLSRMRRVRREELVVLCNGVGPGVLAVDRLLYQGGELAQFSEETVAKLEQRLPGYLSVRNPLDLGYDASPQLYADVLQILGQDPGIANVLVMYTPTLLEDTLHIADSVMQVARRQRLNVFTCWLGQSTVLDARDAFYEAGVPTFFSPEKAIRAFMHFVKHQRGQRLLAETPESWVEPEVNRQEAREMVQKVIRSRRNHLTNREARQLVAAYGIQTLETAYCDDEEEAVEAFREWGGPVNITLLHERGCHPYLEETSGRGRYRYTIRRLNDEAAISNACQTLMEQYRKHFPNSGFLGFAMHQTNAGLEGIGFSLGLTRDAVFGPLIVCGSAGARVNIMSDRRVALPPLNMNLANELLARSNAYRLLREYSPKPEEDIRAVCQTLVTLSQINSDIPEIRGLEILPLLFGEDGAVACDVAIDLGEPVRPVIKPYPRELEEWVSLKSGRKVLVRPIRAEDEPGHLEFHQSQSPETIRYRFFQYRNSFTHDDIARMVQIDYDREMVFIATEWLEDGSERTLGTVRVWTDADNIQCEFAVMVRDDLRGEGLGRILMEKMIRYCKARGTLEMVGHVLPGNEAMAGLARALGFSVTYDQEEDVVALKLPLNKPTEDWHLDRLDGEMPPI
ncbi:bifunctional acetate--CoA ligase family protein/GNAT family N-acetyltransferase [Halospina sp. K52047b]|uniref:bifunctional acetate--CoA ligase family protein/GNAT family N-acetyltransferase n=1 Tax=Halospina sp. K52047b TaxID=2614160 RepID=UPI00124A852D|nr:bifunctional acetate--CoA ligase family protein/GNAT family N-acetyltransferase [Halospina sp. K52047b]KAA8976953.1 GNAT family N-acetyltransferase [Halospina sp. K52047b]